MSANLFDKLFSHLLVPSNEELAMFGEHWIGPKKFSIFEESLVAVYEKNPPTGDGLNVKVYATKMPATSYRIVAEDTLNSVQELQSGFELSTGSGMLDLTVRIAEAASRGMLGAP